MRILLSFFINLSVFSAVAQGIILKGSVYGDTKDNPLPFANIAVVSKSHGTISDSTGFFVLDVSPQDSIYISYVGFQPLTISARDFKDFIILRNQSRQLAEVEIYPGKRMINRTLGFHRKKSNHNFVGPLQYAVFIQNADGKVGLVKTLKFRVSHAVARNKDEKKYSQIRIRVYARNQGGFDPGPDLLTESYIVLVSPTDKVIEADVSRFSIPFPKEGLLIGIDVLGYVENNKIKNYYVGDAKKHLQVAFTPDVAQPLTYINPTGKKWSLMKGGNTHDGGGRVQVNACFGLTVEY
jgi:hypothetical protein